VAVGSFTNSLYLGGTLLANCSVGTLAAGANTVVSCSGVVTAAFGTGPLAVSATADSTNVISEPGLEGNNPLGSGTGTRGVVPTPLRDLSITSLVCSPSSVNQNGTISCTAVIANTGANYAGAFVNDVILSTSNAGPTGTSIGSCSSSPIAGGSSVSVTC